MRKLTVVALAAALAGAGALTLPPLASAQTAANPPAPPAPSVPMPGMMHGAGPHGWMQGPGREGWMRGPEREGSMHGRWMQHEHFHRPDTWGLFERPADLRLKPDDVKIIAEAILLRHGQHDWKVGDVTQNADDTVSFAFVTAHGDVVAQFAINTKTGRISRTD